MRGSRNKKKRLRVFENRVLRKVFGPKRDEVTGEWRKLHNGLLITKYYSAHQIKKPLMGGACGTYGGEQNCIQDFGGEI
jgi:hypothetical protein